MKKIMILGLVLCLMLAACGHEHIVGDYSCDLSKHWYVCADCGETVSEEHVFDDESYCEGCGFLVYDMGDGQYNVMGFDEQGATSSDIYYDANGNILSESFYESEYDENGYETATRTYVDGLLYNEVFYAVEITEDYINHYITQDITYDGDTSVVTDYDKNMNPLRITTRDSAGSILTETVYEYAMDEDLNILYTASRVDGVLETEQSRFVGPDGAVYTEWVRTYGDGVLAEETTFQYEFADDGNLSVQKEFCNGIQTYEAGYQPDTDGWYYLAREVYFDENGEAAEEYRYDAQGNTIDE